MEYELYKEYEVFSFFGGGGGGGGGRGVDYDVCYIIFLLFYFVPKRSLGFDVLVGLVFM